MSKEYFVNKICQWCLYSSKKQKASDLFPNQSLCITLCVCIGSRRGEDVRWKVICFYRKFHSMYVFSIGSCKILFPNAFWLSYYNEWIHFACVLCNFITAFNAVLLFLPPAIHACITHTVIIIYHCSKPWKVNAI